MTGDWNGVRTDLEDIGIKFTPVLTMVYQVNMRGGLNTAKAHEDGGLFLIDFDFDLEKMFGLKGASFFAESLQAWNSGINSDVGALHDPAFAIGSYGDQEIAINKWWFRHRLLDDRVEYRIGKIANIIDLFDKNYYADTAISKFMNRAHISNMVLPGTKGFGAFARVWPTEYLYVQAAVIDPNVDPDYNRRGVGVFHSAFDGNHRFRAFWEFSLNPHSLPIDDPPLPGHYRFGGWFDGNPREVFIDNLDGRLATRYRSGDVGWYFSFDQLLWERVKLPEYRQSVAVFGRLAWSHGDVNLISRYWAAGMAVDGIIPSRFGDRLAFMVSQSILSSDYRQNVDSLADRETIYELYYGIEVAPWLIITPDIQIITNPGGLKNARDAVVGLLRFKIKL